MRKNEEQLGTRAASMSVPATVDPKTRTASLVFSTGAQVQRFSWMRDEAYLEELSLAPGHVRLDRLNSGQANLLNSHSAWDLESVLGVVEAGSARIAAGEAHATVRFSKRESVEDIFQDVADGIIRSVSVGYRVHKFERIAPMNAGDKPIYRAIDWEPYEISLVAMPADAGAGVRGRSADEVVRSFPCEIIDATRAADDSAGARNPEVTLTTPTNPATAGATAGQPEEIRTAPATATVDAAAQAARDAETRKAERQRQNEIRAIAKTARLDDAFVTRHIDGESTLDAVRTDALAQMAAASEAAGSTRSQITVGADASELTVERATEALLHRVNPGAFKLTDRAREFRGLNLRELARDLLTRRSINTRGLDQMRIAAIALGLDESRAGAGYQGTTDLANIVANVMNKTLRRGYENTPRTFVPWASPSTNADFKAMARVQLSDAPQLLKLNASGEYKRGVFSDAKETYALATYGRTVAFNRQMIINDDLSALSRVPQAMGVAAANLESDIVYDILIDNDAMADGTALFHADHGNLDGAGAIAVATLGTMRKLMRLQTGLDKLDGNGEILEAGPLLNLVMKYLIAPAALEQVAYQYTSNNFVPAQASNVNEFRQGGRTAVEPIIEPRLDANSASIWYGAADPGQIDTVEYCHLEGAEGVFTETRVGFDVDGVEMKARHDFAAKAIDHRGLARNG